MKMAKPSARDIAAADELHWILSAIDTRWGGPWETEGPRSLQELLELGSDKSKYYWNGWRNGMMDTGRLPIDGAARQLAAEVVRHQRAH